MLGAYLHNSWIAIFAATGVILSAAYALFLYRRIIFGALVKPALQTIQDLNAREVAILAPLVVITILLGVYPKPVLDVTTPAVANSFGLTSNVSPANATSVAMVPYT
jgi:NADH-quinone oxidoreductase subunit M